VKRIAAVAVAGLALGACGGSSDPDNSPQSANGGPNAQVRDCLKKQGIDLPSPSGGGQAPPPGANGGEGQTPGGTGGAPPLPGGGAPGGGAPPGGAFGGGNSAKMRKAFKACGVDMPNRRNGSGPANNTQYRKSIKQYVSCVRRNGFDMPDPDFSGNGPVFDPDEVDQTDKKFLAASRKCQSLLQRQGQPQGSG
jgi:hypothetical protein